MIVINTRLLDQPPILLFGQRAYITPIIHRERIEQIGEPDAIAGRDLDAELWKPRPIGTIRVYRFCDATAFCAVAITEAQAVLRIHLPDSMETCEFVRKLRSQD